MIKKDKPTKLYDIRKINNYEGYNSFCNGTIFAPRNMKIVGCFTDYVKCINMTEQEIKHQSPPLFKNNLKTFLI